MPRAYHPDFGGEIPFAIEDLPEHPDGQVSATMRRAMQYLREDASSPIIRQQAGDALRMGFAPGRSYAQQCLYGVWAFVRGSMRFKNDDKIAADLAVDDPRKADIIEVLIRPADQAMLIMLRGVGVEDCDGFEMYAGCLLTALGVPVSLVTVSAEPEEPTRFSHVYLAAYVDGQRIPMDFSHGPAIGWECPNTGRLREWPVAVSIGETCEWAWVPLLALAAALYLTFAYRRQHA